MSLMDISDLSVRLGGTKVLRDVALSVEPGEFVGLIGPNGAGKSTLLRAALGLVPAQGAVSIAGRRAETMDGDERARQVAYLPQEREIAWAVTVARVVALGRMPHRAGRWSEAGMSDHSVVLEAMRAMDITHLADRRATELSGGEKARVLIARVLAQRAPLLLADEPTAGLDPAHQIITMRIFAGLTAAGGAVLTCLHDLGLAARWCSRLIVMAEGSIVADGTPQEVLTPELLAEVYGIRAYLGAAEGGAVLQPLDIVPGREKHEPA